MDVASEFTLHSNGIQLPLAMAQPNSDRPVVTLPTQEDRPDNARGRARQRLADWQHAAGDSCLGMFLVWLNNGVTTLMLIDMQIWLIFLLILVVGILGLVSGVLNLRGHSHAGDIVTTVARGLACALALLQFPPGGFVSG